MNMEPLTWTGSLGAVLNPIMTILFYLFVVAIIAQIALSFFAPAMTLQSNPDGTLMRRSGPLGLAEKAVKWLFLALVIGVLIYIITQPSASLAISRSNSHLSGSL